MSSESSNMLFIPGNTVPKPDGGLGYQQSKLAQRERIGSAIKEGIYDRLDAATLAYEKAMARVDNRHAKALVISLRSKIDRLPDEDIHCLETAMSLPPERFDASLDSEEMRGIALYMDCVFCPESRLSENQRLALGAYTVRVSKERDLTKAIGEEAAGKYFTQTRQLMERGGDIERALKERKEQRESEY